MKFAAFILFLFLSSAIFAQSFRLTISRLDEGRAALYSLQGENAFQIDSITSNDNKTFNYTFDITKNHPGFYRLLFKDNKSLDFIYDGEEINLKTTSGSIIDSMRTISSESNNLYYTFIKLNRQFKIKADLLHLILTRYPRDDDFYKITQNKLEKLQSEYLNFVNVTSQKHSGSFIARYIRSSQLPVADYSSDSERPLSFLKAHALDKVDFKDSRLIYSDAFTNKTIEYLSYYRNPQLTKEALESQFIIAVDTILNKAKLNQIVYQHIVEYLIAGFRKFGMEEVLDYIVNNYVIKDDLCLDTKTESMIERRISQNKKLPVNSLAPNISGPDSAGKVIELNNIKADKTVLIFYASWCPHCQEIIPKIADLYKSQKQKTFEVYAVSLDTKRSDWINFIRSYDLNWINVSDLKGWDSKASSEYFIYATPTIFVLNRQGQITAKPLSYEDLKKVLM